MRLCDDERAHRRFGRERSAHVEGCPDVNLEMRAAILDKVRSRKSPSHVTGRKRHDEFDMSVCTLDVPTNPGTKREFRTPGMGQSR